MPLHIVQFQEDDPRITQRILADIQAVYPVEIMVEKQPTIEIIAQDEQTADEIKNILSNARLGVRKITVPDQF